jgi:hypothetical protein
VDGTSVTALVADILFTPDRVGREAIAACEPSALSDAAEREQVLPLVLREAQRLGLDRHVHALQERVRRWTLHETLEREAVRAVLDAVSGTPLLFFKGASLAYATYESPADRMRVDWDILVRDEDEAVADGALRATGFQRDLKTPRGIRTRQQSYRRAAGAGECTIDLHTGVLNAPALARRITFEQLFPRSVPLPSLHPSARGTADIDSLLIACLHRLSHHSDEERLIWDYDITLLADRIERAPAQLDALLARAKAWRVGPLIALEVVRAGTRTRRDVSPLRAGWIDTLASQPSDVMDFARARRSRGDDFLIDWRSLGWKDRLSLVRETLLPDARFVRESSGSALPLPLLYVRRAFRGAAAWLSRPGRSQDPRA